MASPNDPNNAAIGIELVNFASEGEGDPKHGRVTELFPYIVEAEKRMGVRAISRWLIKRGSPISHATISRALRQPTPHWKGFFLAKIRPHATKVSEAYSVPLRDFLFGSSHEFESMVFSKEMSVIVELTDATRVTLDSVNILREQWFVLSKETRANCIPFVTPPGVRTNNI